jgi:hypothetical protein
MPTADYTNTKLANPATLTTSPVVYYTVPSNSRTILTAMTVVNYATGSVSMSLHLVPSGGTVDNTNVLLPNVTISANSLANFNFGQILLVNDTVQAYASIASSVTIHLSGIQIVP